MEGRKMTNCGICGGAVSEFKNRAYNYKNSGLPVIIYGLTHEECQECGETFVEIPEIEKLHLLLSEKLCCKRSRLTGQEIRFLRKELELKAIDFAKVLGITAENLSRIENGKKAAGASLDRLIRSLYILEQSEYYKQVMHNNILSAMKDISNEPAKKMTKAFEFNPTDWLKAPKQIFCIA